MADTLNVYRDQAPKHNPHGSGTAVWIAIIVACLVAGGVGWFFLRDAGHEEQAAAPVDAGQPAKAQLPPSTETDPQVRQWAGPLSTEPEWATWLQQFDLVRVISTATYNISQGESPRQRLSFLAPKEPFKTTTKRRKLVIDPASYARYDAVAKVIGSIDAQAAAGVYKKVVPWLDLALEEVAGPDSKFDPVFHRAVNNLEQVSFPEGDLELAQPETQGEGATFKFADPALEGLTAAQKHLLRMGAKNGKVVQTKLREIATAITGGGSTDADGGTAAADGDAGTTAGATTTTTTTAPAADAGTGGTGTTGTGTPGTEAPAGNP